MSLRRPHHALCPRRGAQDPVDDDLVCTCGESDRRKAAKQASGTSGREAKRAEPYSHGLLSDLRRDPSQFVVSRRVEPHADHVREYETVTNLEYQSVMLPTNLVKDLVDARTACEECPDTNAGDTQRANLKEQKAMKAVCELVRRSYRP